MWHLIRLIWYTCLYCTIHELRQYTPTYNNSNHTLLFRFVWNHKSWNWTCWNLNKNWILNKCKNIQNQIYLSRLMGQTKSCNLLWCQLGQTKIASFFMLKDPLASCLFILPRITFIFFFLPLVFVSISHIFVLKLARIYFK